MAITVIKTPHTQALTGNPIPVRLSTDNVYSVAGQVEKGAFVISAGGSADETFTFTWDSGNKSEVFTLKASPDESGNQIATRGVASYADWMRDTIIPALRSNTILMNDFNIYDSGVDEVAYIEAREKGTAYNITFEETWAINPEYLVDGTHSSQAGVSAVKNDNFKLKTEIWIADSWDETKFTKAGTMEAIPDADGKATFYINKILSSYTERCDIDKALTSITEDTKTVKYFLKYQESFGDPASIQLVKSSGIYYAYKGGYDQSLGADYPDTNGYLYSEIAANNRLLTHAPRPTTERIGYFVDDQHVEEGYYTSSSASTTTLKLVAIGILTAPPYSFQIEVDSMTGIDQYKSYRIPLGYKNLAATLDAYKDDLTWFGVVLKNQVNSTLTSSRTFFYDRKSYENVDYILFPNSLGSYDSIRLTGPKVVSKESAYETFGKSLPVGYTGKNSPVGTSNYTGSEVTEVSTGWLTKEQQQWLSNEIQHKDGTAYLLVDGELQAIEILSNSLEKSKTSQDLPSLKIKYRKAFNDKFYTND